MKTSSSITPRPPTPVTSRQALFRLSRPALLRLLAAGIVCFGMSSAYASAEPGAWYRGDLHMHSTHSDGDNSVAEVLDQARKQGLDFIALTDHDSSMNGQPSQWTDPDYQADDLILLYGVEWTTGKGHANIWASHPMDYTEMWAANRAQDADAAIVAAHAQGALFSINHPAAYECCPWEYAQTEPVDGVEVWNGSYRAPSWNGQATHVFWDGMLQDGLRPTAVGGSDTHSLQFPDSYFWTIGNPTTWIYAETPSADGLLAGIAAGNVSVSFGPDAPRLEMLADADGDGRCETMMGEEVLGGRRIDFLIRLVNPESATPREQGRPIPVRPVLLKKLEKGALTPEQVYQKTLNERGLVANETGHMAFVFKSGNPTQAVVLPYGTNAFGFHDQPLTGDYFRVEVIGFPGLKPSQHVIYGMMTAISNPIYVR